MKKLLAILLCIAVMPLGIFNVSAAEDESRYTDSYNRLVGLGLVDDEQEYIEEQELTRLDFVKILGQFLKIYDQTKDAKVAEKTFGDIDVDDPYAAMIEYMAEREYLSGFGDGKFYPDGLLTYNQAVKAFICVLGYNSIESVKENYPDSYLKQAASIKLTKGVGNQGEKCTYGTVLKLMDNCLDIKVLETVFDSKFSQKVSDETFLESYYKITYKKGVIDANKFTSLTNITGRTADDEISIGGVLYEDITGLGVKYLGCDVEYYIEEYDNNEYRIVYMFPTNKNDEVTVPEKDILPSICNEYKFAYELNNRTKTIDLNDDTHVIYNGYALPLYDGSIFNIVSGEVRLLDNDGDGNYECIFIANASEHYVASTVSKDNDAWYITDKADKTKVYKLLADMYEDYSVVLFKNGEEIEPDKIEDDDVLSIGTHPSGAVGIYVGGTSITGKIDSVDTSDSIAYAKINDTEYPVCAITVEMGMQGTFFVNCFGEICAYIKENPEGMKYAMLLDMRRIEENEGMPEYVRVKLMTPDGEIASYYLNEKVKLNGSGKKAEKVADAIESTDSRAYDEGRAYSISKGNAIRQMCQFSQNEAGYIDKLNLVTSDGDLVYDQKDTVTYKWDFNSYCLQNKYYVTSSTQNFYWLPENDDCYTNQGLIRFVANGDNTNYTVYAYNLSDSRNADMLMIVDALSTGSNGVDISNVQISIIEKCVEAVDDDNEVVTMLVLKKNGAEIEVMTGDKTPSATLNMLSELNKGDAIMYSTDTKGKLSKIYRIVDREKLTQYGSMDWSTGLSGDIHTKTTYKLAGCNYGFAYVRAERVEDGMLIFRDNENGIRVQSLGSATNKVYVVTNDRHIDIKAATVADIRPGDNVLVRSNYAKYQECYVFR